MTWPLNCDVFLLERELFTLGDLDLRRDEIDAGQLFGDRVLDLDAGVDFHEVEVLVFIEKKLDGADRVVFGGFDDCLQRFADFFAHGCRENRG